MNNDKYRAWDKKNKRWYSRTSNDYICVGDGIVVLVVYSPTAKGNWEPSECRQLTHAEVDNLEIVRYTGRKDDNNKELYVGDIVKYDMACIGDKPNIHKAEIMWDDESCCYYFSEEEISRSWDDVSNHYQVERIGTIYENPELLKR